MQSAVLYDVAAFRIARVSLDEAFGSLDDSEASRAKLELESASNLDHGLGVSSLTAMIPILRAQLLLAQSKWAEAGAIYAEAVPVASIHGQGRWAARFLAEHSHCEAMLGKCESARALAERALSSLATSIDVDDAAACHARIARAFLACGIEQDAEEQRQIANELRTKHREVQTRLLASFEPILQGASVI
jgi:tetratricopeptide (TPR) repeat protein